MSNTDPRETLNLALALDHVAQHGFGDNVDADSIIEAAARSLLPPEHTQTGGTFRVLPATPESEARRVAAAVWQIGVEAVCRKCGDHFVPSASLDDPEALIHYVRNDTQVECGGQGEVVGSWGSNPS